MASYFDLAVPREHTLLSLDYYVSDTLSELDVASDADDDATSTSTSMPSIFSAPGDITPLVDDGEEPGRPSIYDQFRRMRAPPVLATIPPTAQLYGNAVLSHLRSRYGPGPSNSAIHTNQTQNTRRRPLPNASAASNSARDVPRTPTARPSNTRRFPPGPRTSAWVNQTQALGEGNATIDTHLPRFHNKAPSRRLPTGTAEAHQTNTFTSAATSSEDSNAKSAHYTAKEESTSDFFDHPMAPMSSLREVRPWNNARPLIEELRIQAGNLLRNLEEVRVVGNKSARVGSLRRGNTGPAGGLTSTRVGMVDWTVVLGRGIETMR